MRRCFVWCRNVFTILFIFGIALNLGWHPAIALADTQVEVDTEWMAVPETYSDSWILIDGDTGEVILEQDSHAVKYPASITKICTALITLENHELSDMVTLKGEALQKLPDGYVSMNPVKNEKVSVEDMLYELLMNSANDAGNGLAVYDAGSIADFADKMNERAAKAGAQDTHFTNPSGLFDENHTTTAYDMAMIMKDCIKLDAFNKIASDLSHTIEKTNKSGARAIYSHVQPLLPNSAYYNEEVFSGKTGFTTPSRYTMVTAAKRGDKTLICVVMNCASEDARCVTSKRLFEYGFYYEDVQVTLGDILELAPEDTEEGLLDMINHPGFHRVLKSADIMRVPVGTNLSDLDVTITPVVAEGETPGAVDVTYTFSHAGETLGEAVMEVTPVHQINLSKDPEFQFASWKILWAAGLLLILLVLVVRSTDWKKLFGMKKEKLPAVDTLAETVAGETAKASEPAVHQEPDALETPSEEVEAAAVVSELKNLLKKQSGDQESKEAVKEVIAEVIPEDDKEDMDPEELKLSGESKEDILAQVKALVEAEAPASEGSESDHTEE